jgi:hypothetical protein
MRNFDRMVMPNQSSTTPQVKKKKRQISYPSFFVNCAANGQWVSLPLNLCEDGPINSMHGRYCNQRILWYE